MGLKFKIMELGQLGHFLKFCIPYYAQMMVDVGEYPDYDRAYNQSYRETMSYFAKGVIPDSELMYHVITEKDSTDVGYLWISLVGRNNKPCAFVCWISIHDQYCRQGYAKQTMLAMEEFLGPKGYCQYELYVFSNNIGAIQLYQHLGYRIVKKKALGQAQHITRFVMQKEIDQIGTQ